MLPLVGMIAGRRSVDDEEEAAVRNEPGSTTWPDEPARAAALATRGMDAAMARLNEQERNLEFREAFLEHLSASGPVVLFRAHPVDFSLGYVSPNVQRLLGYAPADLLRAPGVWLNCLDPEERLQLQERLRGAAERGEREISHEGRFRCKDGRHRWLYSTFRMDYDLSGQPAAILGYALDVTERREAEAALERAREEAERANRAKSEFLSRMSHELRTPLNAVIGFAQLLEMSGLPPVQREGVGHILTAGRHLLDVLNEVLDVARVEAGRMQLTIGPVSLDVSLRESLDLIAPLAAQRSIRLSAPSFFSGNCVLADRVRLNQILLNLLSNAVKYNHEGGEVNVTLKELGGERVRLCVQDTGPGIPPEALDRLFTPFDRLGAERSEVEGFGLGLALCKRLAEAMNGRMGMDGGERGCTFWLELPKAAAPDAREEGPTYEDEECSLLQETPAGARDR